MPWQCSPSGERSWLVVVLLLTVAIRLGAWFLLQPEMTNDAQAYFAMADAMSVWGAPVDHWGQHAFYSVGYPVILAPAFAMFGSSVASAVAVNVALAALSGWLVYTLARKFGLPLGWSLLAVAVHAVWLPGIWNTAQLTRENLSTPLMLTVVWLSLRIVGTDRVAREATYAGIAWSAAVLAGGSALFLILVPLVALWLAHARAPVIAVRGLVALGIGTAMLAVPWALLTDAMVGQPVLNTNGGFNLYLGHNPAATGHFVSIADTPAGADWNSMRTDLGEVGASARLGDMAKAYMADHPGRTAWMTVRKLVLFWTPNTPDAAELAGAGLMGAVRVAEVAQYLVLLAFGAIGLTRRSWPAGARWLIICAIGSFWAIHGIAYNIPRYRDPVMPLIMVAAVIGLRALVHRRLPSPEAV